jgi:hypothetical protein
MRARAAIMALTLAAPALAQTSPDFPTRSTYVIHLGSGQSSLGEYLVPPLEKAFRKAGLRYKGGPGAAYAATVESTSDVGSWQTSGGEKVWLYERFVTVGLSPADIDIEPEGRLSPSFAIAARILTPDEDRVDELECLVALAVRELAARYRPTGRVVVNGQGCARR